MSYQRFKQKNLAFFSRILKQSNDGHGAVAQSKVSHLKRFRKMMELGDFNGKSLLDVGCGVGGFYGFLKERDVRVDYTGIDICEDMIRAAKQDYPAVADSLTGRKYRAANGGVIPDQGSRKVIGRIGDDGPLRSAKFWVAKVSRALMYVADMVDQRQRVIFDRDDDGDCSYILDKKTSIQTRIERRNRVYEPELLGPPYPNGGQLHA